MADDKSKTGGEDRGRVSGSEEYEVRYFAESHGISIEQAQKLIDEHGNNRDTLDAAAERLKQKA